MGRTSDARERLVESGSELMHQRGYTAVGVSEVCSRAGVQKGSFYHFFPSKLELALAVIDEYQAVAEAALEMLESGEEPPLERLVAYADGVHQYQTELYKSCDTVIGCPLGNLALEMSTQEPELRERLRMVFSRNIERFERVVQEAVDRGEVDSLDSRKAARSILALVEGSILLAKMNDDPEILNDLGEDILRLIGGAEQGEP